MVNYNLQSESVWSSQNANNDRTVSRRSRWRRVAPAPGTECCGGCRVWQVGIVNINIGGCNCRNGSAGMMQKVHFFLQVVLLVVWTGILALAVVYFWKKYWNCYAMFH